MLTLAGIFNEFNFPFRYFLLVVKAVSVIIVFSFFQDLPEFFEDNLKVWMSYFLKLLTLDNELLKSVSIFNIYPNKVFQWTDLYVLIFLY